METIVGNRYRLVREVGAGGMGRVFQAVDTRTGNAVAAKLLLASAEIDLEALLRFQQEGAVLAALKHPNIVQVYGTFLEEDCSCIVMEFLEGSPLSRLLQQGPLPLTRVKMITSQVAAALGYAHGRGIVHRDIKPANIVIVGADHVKVTDFGIARILGSGGTLNTKTGTSVGTPLYMSPEQIEGGRIDGRTDIYALGAVMYQMVSGRPPFEGDDPVSIAFKHVHRAPQPPSVGNAGIPSDWEQLILTMLAKDPSNRIQTAIALEDAIRKLSDSASGPTVPRTTRSTTGRTGTRSLHPVPENDQPFKPDGKVDQLPRPREPDTGHRNLWLLSSGAVVLALIVGVFLFTRLTQGGTDYGSRVRSALAPMVSANRELSGRLANLTAGSGATPALASELRAEQAATSARAQVDGLGNNGGTVVSDARAALDNEIRYLAAVKAQLSGTQDPSTSHVVTLQGSLQQSLQSISPPLTNARSSVSGVDALISWETAKSFGKRVQAAFAPMLNANRNLSSQLAALNATSQSDASRQSELSAEQATARARTTIAGLGSHGGSLIRNAQSAVVHEATYLTTVRTTLQNPQDPSSSQLLALEISLQDRLDALSPTVPFGGGTVSGAAKLVAWAAAQVRAQGKRNDLSTFAANVDSILQRSAPSYQEINLLFQQMQGAINGTDSITLLDAESGISDVIANRSALGGSARILVAPNAQADQVKQALVKAFDASLQNDRDIQSCLNLGASSGLASLFRQCLNGSATSSTTASNAKSNFTSLYNALRTQIGLSPLTIAF